MNYKLALKLKKHGFPQKKLDITGGYVGICKHGFFGFSEGRESCDCGEAETVHIPTLSELIEASLREGAMQLNVTSKSCGAWWGTKHERKTFAAGSTPLEAVANLWLELNKKK